MTSRLKSGFELAKRTFQEWSKDDCPRLAAALSYYTVFSLPAVLVLVMVAAGSVFGQDAVEGRITAEIGEYVGPDVAEQVQTMVRGAQDRVTGAGGLLTLVLGIAGLIFGATGAFFQLQKALNAAWEVAPDPAQSGVKSFLVKRVVSFLIIVVTALLLMLLMLVTPVITSLGSQLVELLPGGLSRWLLQGLDAVVSLGVFTLVFAALYKVVPDAVISWRNVWIGAFATAVLFVIGKFALGVYLSRSDPAGAFGAAGWLAVLLIWIYIASMIFFLGAEFTQVWSRRHGEPIRPEPGAVHVVQDVRPVRDGEGPEGAAEASADGASTSHRPASHERS